MVLGELNEEFRMNRLLLILCTTAALHGADMAGAARADPVRDDPNRPDLNGQRNNMDRRVDPLQRDDLGKQDPDQPDPNAHVPYFSAQLRRCETMSGQDRTNCVEAVKRKLGQM
jgi:hypothetical protein